MNQNNKLTILEFSKLTGIKRDNLRFYDRIQLLSPEFRGDNNYRYYSRHQLNSAYFITSLRGLGVGIEEIKEFSSLRTPETALQLLSSQDARIQEEIERLCETRLIMKEQSTMIEEALSHEEGSMYIRKKSQEPIFLCPEPPKEMNLDDSSIFYYDYAEEMGVNLGFSQGTMISYDELLLGTGPVMGRYYFKDESKANAVKPEGWYAVIYGKGDPWESLPLYDKLIAFIKDQGLRICGNAYEEYLLNDISVSHLEDYCIRIEILVEQDTL